MFRVMFALKDMNEKKLNDVFAQQSLEYACTKDLIICHRTLEIREPFLFWQWVRASDTSTRDAAIFISVHKIKK